MFVSCPLKRMNPEGGFTQSTLRFLIDSDQGYLTITFFTLTEPSTKVVFTTFTPLVR